MNALFLTAPPFKGGYSSSSDTFIKMTVFEDPA
jgi:hypothetical protein